MYRARNVLFRPTGISLLVGMIELHPGNLDTYLDAVQPFRESWGKLWRSRFEKYITEDSRGCEPEDFYEPCDFVGLGAWDLISLTIMSEKGLATHLPFIGHARGQSFYAAYDFSLVLEADNAGKTITRALARLAKMARTVGVTDLVRTTDDRIRKSWGDHDKFFEQRTPLPHSHVHAHFRPLTLNHIRPSTGMVKAGKANRELVGLYQLKLNQVLLIHQFEWVHSLAYLTILAICHKMRRTKRKRPGKPLVELLAGKNSPTIVKPLYCDGYFDLMLLLRGPHLPPMEYLVQEIKFLTLREALHILEEEGLAPLMEKPNSNRFLGEPLFELTHSTIGFPNEMRTEAMTAMGRYLDGIKPSDLIKSSPSQRVRKAIAGSYKSFRRIFKPFNHPKLKGDSKEAYQITPGTAIAVNAGKLTRTMVEIDRFHSQFWPNRDEEPRFELGETFPLMYGSHDLELFPGAKTCFLGDMLADHQFLKYMMMHRVRQSDNGGGILFRERTHSPLLSLDSRIALPRYQFLEEYWQKKESPSRIPDHFKPPIPKKEERPSPKRSLCVLTEENLRRIIDGLEGKLEDMDDFQSRFLERKAFWEQVFQSIGQQTARDTRVSLLQNAFKRFTKQFFGPETTPETLESLQTAFWVVDGGLSDPLRFNLFLDVKRYMEALLSSMFTLHALKESVYRIERDTLPKDVDIKEYISRNPVPRELVETVRVRFFDVEKQDIVSKEATNRKLHYGLEAYLLQIVDLIHKICGQRTNGCFPFHDRSYSRISDLRTFHTKKLVCTSWMINNIMEEITNTVIPALPFQVERVGHVCTEDLKAGLNQFEPPARHYLARFTNSPLAMVDFTGRSIALNSRQLTTIESLILLFHEIGHVFDRNLFDSDIKDGNDPGSEDLASFDSWKEICSDLFAFKFCFAPLNRESLANHFNARLAWDEAIFPMTRTHVYTEAEHEYDMADLFIMAWIFQLLLHPKQQRLTSFHNLVKRLILNHVLIKAHLYMGRSDSPLSQELLVHIQPSIKMFFDKKLPQWLNHLAAHAGSDLSDCAQHASCNVIQHNLNDSYWMEQLARCPEKRSALLKTCNVELGNHWSFFVENMADIPRLAMISYLADPRPLDCEAHSPYLELTALCESDGKIPIANLMEGILKGFTRYKNPDDYFAAAAQILGLINLGFCGNARSPTVYSEGYPGFARHREQQNLARMRQLAAMLLLQGGAKAMDNYLTDSDSWF